MIKIGMISLGCSKNSVDSEIMLGYLIDTGFVLTVHPETADIIIVNTCGFITPAKQESIDTILEMAQYKNSAYGSCRLLVVMGCLSERYRSELPNELPEVDLFWGVGNHEELAQRIFMWAYPGCAMPRYTGTRVLTTPFYSAYLKIAEGCDNKCTYCAIPLIRGNRKSVPMKSLIDQAKALADGGVTELTLIAQDTSAYGVDIYGASMLSKLLKELTKIDGLNWIRTLYSYPNTVTEELVDTILSEDKLVNYIDMPIQHIDSEILHAMNRHGTREHIEQIVKYIRKASNNFILRTTVMTGFPGESDSQFNDLLNFLKANPFDRLGAFAFSKEESTQAYNMSYQVDEATKQRRLDLIMNTQQQISLELNMKRINTECEVLIDSVENGMAIGRSKSEAPDVDGYVSLALNGHSVQIGEYIDALITDATEYDLWGEIK